MAFQNYIHPIKILKSRFVRGTEPRNRFLFDLKPDPKPKLPIRFLNYSDLDPGQDYRISIRPLSTKITDTYPTTATSKSTLIRLQLLFFAFINQ